MHFPKHCAVWMTNMWGRGKNASDASWCVPSFRSLTPWLCITWHGSRGGLSHSSHWCGVHCCWTWLQSRLNHELSVNDWLLVFGYRNCNLNPEREKEAGNRCVISRNTNSTSIHGPRDPGHRKTFTLHLAYWSHSGFLKGENGTLSSAGSNTYAGQVRFYAKNHLKAVLAKTQLSSGQSFYLPVLTFP